MGTTKTTTKRKNVLPSGSCRIQVYDYTDEEGKKHYKSFTAPTKKLAQMAAAEWKADKVKHRITPDNMTLKDAAERYITVKNGALSPSTVIGYRNICRNHLSGYLGRIKLIDIDSATMQIWISDLAARLSPKSVSNAYGFVSAVMGMFAPDTQLHVKLPAAKKPALYCPNDQDIKTLLSAISGTELESAVLLAAFGPLRRGEISALDAKHIRGNMVTIEYSMVLTEDKEWVLKQPKTPGSYRTIEMPAWVIDRIRKKRGRIVELTPNQITQQFGRKLKQLDIPHFRFHDLRHYAASIMHAIGIPDQYILQRGGWATDNVMKTVYRNVIDLEAVKQNKKINKHFDQLKAL